MTDPEGDQWIDYSYQVTKYIDESDNADDGSGSGDSSGSGSDDDDDDDDDEDSEEKVETNVTYSLTPRLGAEASFLNYFAQRWAQF